MDFAPRSKIRPTKVTVHSDSPVALSLGLPDLFTRCKVLYTVSEHIRVGVAEDEGSEFHDTYKAREVKDFGVGISSIKNPREVEELCALVYFCPETLLENFLRVLECRSFLDQVKVSEHADNFREAMRLQNIQELEGFLYYNEQTSKTGSRQLILTISKP